MFGSQKIGGKIWGKENREIEKVEGKKTKSMFKVNKLFLYVFSNSFNLFLSII